MKARQRALLAECTQSWGSFMMKVESEGSVQDRELCSSGEGA